MLLLFLFLYVLVIFLCFILGRYQFYFKLTVLFSQLHYTQRLFKIILTKLNGFYTELFYKFYFYLADAAINTTFRNRRGGKLQLFTGEASIQYHFIQIYSFRWSFFNFTNSIFFIFILYIIYIKQFYIKIN